MDYRQFYDLEKYLLTTVHDRFHDQGYLSAFDFFCIVIWKANRAKSKVAKRLLANSPGNIESAVRELTADIFQAPSAKEKLSCLVKKWGVYISMASAILAILFPNKFTIYDVRVCDSLSSFHQIANIYNFERLWHEYQKFKQAMNESAPSMYSLQDKDRYLWGLSFKSQLELILRTYEKAPER
jgi:hypothetical protein